MSSENFSNNRISRDETIKYLKSIKNELNEKFEKTKIELDMVDKMIAKRIEEIGKESGNPLFTSVLSESHDFSNVTCPSAIMQVIIESKKALSAKEIADKLLQNGYKTEAKNFEKIVYNTLYNALKSKGKVQKQGNLWLES